jgi:hypothetical protein
MRLAQALPAAFLGALLLQSAARAIVVKPSQRDVERAQKLAQAPEPQRVQFHAPYIVRVDTAVVEQIEVITEYRRYVLATEEQLRAGNWMFAQSPDRAQEKVKPWRGRLTLSARLRFHPQNTLIGMPPYEISIADPDLEPLEVTRTPINGFASGKRRDQSAPMLGAIVEVAFEAASIGQTARPVRVSLRGEAVAGTTIDFARLE